jgi:hypothetical protein
MRTNTQSITIEARPQHVFEFVVDLEKLPRWAIGFAKEIRRDNGSWLVRTGSGDEVAIRAVADSELGVVDFHMSPVPGVEFPAATRVLPNEDGAEYVFTMFQPLGMPDEAFEQQIAELGRELVVLKANIESACPL